LSRLSLVLFSLAVGTGAALAFLTLPNPWTALGLLAAAACFVLWLWSPSGTKWRDAILADAPGETLSSPRRNWAWFLAGFLLLGASLFLLEWRQPYYFTQDDALACELPGLLVGCRGVWAGVWPNYNPYSLMGAPLANLGLYSLTYPPTYLAYAIARHVLVNEYATLEVFAVLHLAVGYAVTFGLVRQMRASGAGAAIVALSTVLSGSSLIMGRCWPAFVPLVVWLPILAWGLVRLRRGPVGWLWTAAMGGAMGATFHVGFPQLSLTVAGFFAVAVAVLVLLGEVPLRRAYHALPALLVGVGLALPIALPQVHAAETMGPRGGVGAGLPFPDAWLCMIAPYPLGQAEHPNHWGTFDREYMGQLYFFGTLLGVLFFANALALFTSRFRWSQWRGQIWLFAALFTLLLMAGDAGWLWALLRRLPITSRITSHPFRLLPFFVLFASLAGGLVLERMLRLSTRRGTWELILGVAVGGLLLYHVALARPSFYTYAFQPGAPLPAEMNSILEPTNAPTGRLMAWSPLRSTHPASAIALSNALPSVYGIPAFHGYDPVVENTFPFTAAAAGFRATPLEAARAYGIRWHLTVRELGPVRSVTPDVYLMEEKPPFEEAYDVLKPLKLPAVYESGPVLLTELDGVDPLAFAEGHPDQPLPLRMNAAGLDVEVGAAGGEATIVNFLWRPEMQATVDGAPIPCNHDEWLRMRVEVPLGGKKLELRYAPDWSRGLLYGGAAVLLGVGLKLLLRRVPME
jgi:hypothetical protein